MITDEKIRAWATEYVELMAPDDDLANQDDRANDARVHTARVRACWIVEALIERGTLQGVS
jgi:hypothetical protein